MTEPEAIDRVIIALLRVPEKKLLIIELANTIPIINGELDYTELADRQLAVNLAIAEAKVYGAKKDVGQAAKRPMDTPVIKKRESWS